MSVDTYVDQPSKAPTRKMKYTAGTLVISAPAVARVLDCALNEIGVNLGDAMELTIAGWIAGGIAWVAGFIVRERT